MSVTIILLLNCYAVHLWLFIFLVTFQVVEDENWHGSISVPLVAPGKQIFFTVDAVILLGENTEKFKTLYSQNADFLHNLVKELETVADGLERVHYRATVGSLTGGVVGAAGGITSIVGLALAPVTLGASLIVTGVGIGIAVAGGATSAASNITNMAIQSADRKNIERIINEYREKMEPILICIEDICRSLDILKQYESFIGTPNMFQAGCRIGRGLGGIAELVRLIQVANIGKVAAQASRAVRVAEVFTGVLSGLFVALDAYFIYKDSKEIHEMRQTSGDSTIIANIRDMASSFKEKLSELESIKAELDILEF
uniref:Apolipoprotein L3-like n=1 Tax=Scleropages formosus TaxID=113540 RepID=A0A8C9RTJ8_SCLFO